MASASSGAELRTPSADFAAEAAEGPRPQAYLSLMPAGAHERGLALAAIMVSAAIFAIAIPYAKVPLLKVPAFIPIYESALLINELITAVLLLGQFVQLRSRALLLLACAYFFEALLIIPHALTFPGLFAEKGLLGAGPQSTAYLYMFWHFGFPVLVIAYAVVSGRNGNGSHKNNGRANGNGTAKTSVGSDIAIAVAAAGGAALLATLICTSWMGILPAIMDGNGYTSAFKYVVATVWIANAVALWFVWRKPNRSALDWWLIVVMCAWIFDIGLGAVFNAGRYDLGFYAGRVYGLLAASFVLGALLLETSGLYSRLARNTTALERQTRELQKDIRERMTEQEKTEAQLHQAQKMEAIGNLTGGMAHDFNNMLAVIIGSLEQLSERRPNDAEVQTQAGAAIDAAVRGADLTRRLLAFARRQPLKPERIDVNELVVSITKLLGRTLGENVEVVVEPSTDVWPVVADPAQLQSSIANLATNARDAMPEGGRLIIATANRHLDADYAERHADVTPGDYAMIEVRDTGSGMPEAVLTRIFEPFFTTKEQGKGTGLGLAMVYGFAKQSKGHINVYSEVGVGTVFRIYLPRADKAAAASSAAAPTNLMGRGETVLAVEDNPVLREMVVRRLGELGYKTLEAPDAAAAMLILERETIDLLLTDVIMPGGTSGHELAKIALARWPKLRVVFTSGFPDTKFEGGVGGRPALLLSKPYRRDDLGRILRQAFEA